MNDNRIKTLLKNTAVVKYCLKFPYVQLHLSCCHGRRKLLNSGEAFKYFTQYMAWENCNLLAARFEILKKTGEA